MLVTIDLSLNQIVAHNITQLRWDRRWSEEETAKKLGALLGRRISLASYSAMERSVEGRRIKRFDADEIFAFARVFGVGVFSLLNVPLNFQTKPVRVRLRGASESISRVAALTVIGLGPAIPIDIVEDASRAMRHLSGEQGVVLSSRAPLSPAKPTDAAVIEIVKHHFFMRPKAERLADQEEQAEELKQALAQIVEARQQRGPRPNEKQARKPAAAHDQKKSRGRNKWAGSKGK